MRRPQWGPQTAGWAPPYDPGPVSVHGAQVTHGGFDSVSLSVTFRFCCFVCLLVYFCDHSCASPFVLPRALYRSSPGVDAQLIRAAPLQSAAPLTPSYDFFIFFSRVFFARGGLFSAATRQLDVSVRWTRRRRERCARREKNGLRTLLCHIKGSDSVLLLVMLGCSRGEERFCRRSAVPCRIFTQRSSLESNGVTCSWKAPQRFR